MKLRMGSHPSHPSPRSGRVAAVGRLKMNYVLIRFPVGGLANDGWGRRGNLEHWLQEKGKMKKVQHIGRNVVLRGVLLIAFAFALVTSTYAQIDTNAPAILSGVVTSNFNSAAAVGIGMLVVGLIVWAILKGFSLRKSPR